MQQRLLDQIEFESEYVAERPDELMDDREMDDVEMDHFKVTIKYRGISHSLYFSMGIGHRIEEKFVPWEFEQRALKKKGFIKSSKPNFMFKPRGPEKEEVIDSLLVELVNGETFSEWCDSLGYSNDSIKALKIYDSCISTTRQLFGMFGIDGIEKLREELEEAGY